MGSTPYDTDEDWDGEDQLDLADDESLPWLEAGEDEDEAQGFDTSRLVMLAVLALALLGAVVGAIWFVTNQTSDEPEADGSLIAAPEEPYKTKPEDPGGKTFAGTGDTSFAVGEGQTREGRLAEPAPKPSSAPAPRMTITRSRKMGLCISSIGMLPHLFLGKLKPYQTGSCLAIESMGRDTHLNP